MSYYKAICLSCPDKRWIKPGTENGPKPLHEIGELDNDHPAAPISYSTGIAQQRMLDRALAMIREQVPGAVSVDMETSDQARYGFVLTSVRDADGNNLLPAWDDTTHPLAGLSDDVGDQISDLNWNGVVGEGYGGYVTLDLRTGEVVASS
jgi:hypothetical protein